MTERAAVIAIEQAAPAVRTGQRMYFVDLLKLLASVQMIHGHTLDAVMADHLRSEPLARVDYIEIVDEDTFEAISYVNENIVLVGAILIGNTRLIDNLPLVVPEA